MKCKSLLIGLFLISFFSFGQVKELENFRKEIEFFINYDHSKTASTPESEANTLKFKQNLEKAFIEFVMNKDSKNLDQLKNNSINNKTSYVIGNHNYFFDTPRIDPYKKSLENNSYYKIVLYPIYDYELSQFVSFYMQPFNLNEKQYVIYYYKLNGEGTYYIKDIAKNIIVFKGQALTSNAAISKFDQIDDSHFLVVEDMGYDGQRAFVIKNENNLWQPINAFKGKSFKPNSVKYDIKNEGNSRKYLRFANSKNIKNTYPIFYFKNYEINFDPKSKMISYKKADRQSENGKKIESKWENNSFTIDDYYLGEDLNDQPVPMP
ncbi:hypothetical protein [Chryseobacterium paridis]|uniref:Uncharacterized protein n=1 Tax=Chryseobacterium paridis TaxID=2800328 RepID=A0ABS1FTP3_9FLAO|nr:hypothetical protein [Chryseobacterium paridis]MBK1895797.1 hypothetical protein [Chryseobacterium paridis]